MISILASLFLEHTVYTTTVSARTDLGANKEEHYLNVAVAVLVLFHRRQKSNQRAVCNDRNDT